MCSNIALLIGHGDNNSRNIPVQVKDVSNVSQVACGSAHTVCVSVDGAIVWSFGSGDNGNLLEQISYECEKFLAMCVPCHDCDVIYLIG